MLRAMVSRRRSLLGICLWLCYPAMTMAQTYIVDAANGPGTNFTDLPAAAAAAPDGAVLEVRAGNYSGFTITNKGMSVLFASGARIQSPVSGTSFGVDIQGIGPAQTVLLRGLNLTPSAIVYWWSLSNCQGLVMFEDCGRALSAAVPPSLFATNCTQVSLDRCQLGWDPSCHHGATLVSSNVVFRSSYVAWVDATACHLQFLDSAVSSFSCGYPSVAPAIQMTGGDTRVQAGSMVATMFNWSVAGNGALRVDPRAGLNAPTSPSIQPNNLEMPAADSTGGSLGGSVTTTVRGPTGDVGALLVGLPGPPVQFPGFADVLWLQPGTESVCTFAAFTAGTALTVTYAVPNVQALRGLRLCWHGVSFGVTNGLQASNPAITTHW